jgi:hypothetical protein
MEFSCRELLENVSPLVSCHCGDLLSILSKRIKRSQTDNKIIPQSSCISTKIKNVNQKGCLLDYIAARASLFRSNVAKRPRLKHASRETNTHATTEVFEEMFLFGIVRCKKEKRLCWRGPVTNYEPSPCCDHFQDVQMGGSGSQCASSP